ncbi:MAG: phenylacetate-CoA oxygenase subunit PaaC [Chitinophagales bacterium]|nr:phenylacetate-CoA oxygenase subunit PaaC [Chitinophagales bacterium]
MNIEATKDLLYRMADDELIIGHRNSEWTGLGPILEEDIAFSSMAQDKIGHAKALYEIMHTLLGEDSPDKLAFGRKEEQYRCCHLVEHPIGEFDFSLVRHFLFDHSELLRYEMLKESSFTPLAQLSKKIFGELKYHVLHADTWMKQLANGTEESRARLQSSLNECYPLALAIFEEGDFEKEIIDSGVFTGEGVLKEKWMETIQTKAAECGLTLPADDGSEHFGGRKGYHTEHLKPMLNEMTEVFSLDPNAEW